VTPPTSGRLSARVTAALDEYALTVLGCPPELAQAGGLHILSEPRRGLPAWHGFTLPIVGLSFSTGAVVACRPDLVASLRAALGSDVGLRQLDSAAFRRLGRAIQQCTPHAFSLAGDFRAAATATFTPSATSQRAELLAEDDAAALHLRTRFDGSIFGVRGPRGRLISWAALKRKSAQIWELAVATEADYRGRGYARDVVSAATAYTLEHGRVPTYIHDRDNSSSRFVARAVGYQFYAEIVFAEY
jgi:RimJ/RimL family protein N-acetyltransferase